MTKIDGKFMATIEIYGDEIPKSLSSNDQKKYLQNIKKQLKVYYDCKLKNIEADIAKDKLDNEFSLNKIVFKAIDEIELPYIEKLKFLQYQKIESRIEYLMKAIN